MATNCEEYDWNECGNYIYSEEDDKTKQCIFDYEKSKCQFKSCSELSAFSCGSYISKDEDYRCMHKLGTNHCELQKCSDLDTTQCYEFRLNDEENICTLNEDRNACEITKCSNFDITKCLNFETNNGKTCIPLNGVCQEKSCDDFKSTNCGDFITSSSSECIPKGEGCVEVYKKCDELPYNKCDYYYNPEDSSNELEPKCLAKEDNSGCELKSCYDFRSNECSKFTFEYYYLKICAPDGKDGCEIKTCTTTPKGQCNKFNELAPSSKLKKCVEPENESEVYCREIYKSCEEFKYNECRSFSSDGDLEFNFRYTKDAKRCISKLDNTSCEIKRCSELSVDECNRLNYQGDESNICVPKKDNSGCEIKMCKELTTDRCHLASIENFWWKCVEKNDKCVELRKECSEMPFTFCEVVLDCHLNEAKNKCLAFNEDDNDKDKDNDNDNDNTNGINFLKLSFFCFIFNVIIY